MTPAEELKSLVGGPQERNALLEELGSQVSAALRQRLARILELVSWLLDLLELKNLSLQKLRQLCFGAQTESSRNVCGTPPNDRQKTKAKGHGRHCCCVQQEIVDLEARR